MQKHSGNQDVEPRLRVVFTETCLALDLPAGATWGDMAERVTRLARRRRSAPAAIDIRMAAPRANLAMADMH